MAFNRLFWIYLLMLAGASSAGAQTLSQCKVSFVGFQPVRTATFPVSGQSTSCASLEALRVALTLTPAEEAHLTDANARIARFRAAKTEASAQLAKEARATTTGAVNTAARSGAASYAVFRAIQTCIKKVPDPAVCAKRVRSAQRSVGKAIDEYYDSYQTNKTLQQSSATLLSILDAKIEIAEGQAATLQEKADAFLATCALVAQECVIPPLPAPALH